MDMEASEHPLHWEYIVAAVEEGGEGGLSRLKRSKDVLELYERRKQQILSDFDSVGDYILVQYLRFPSMEGEEGKMKADMKQASVGSKMVYCLNDFPYHVAPGIEHGIVWSAGKLVESEMIALLRETLGEREFVYFVNPPSLQSVQEVEHAQVFSRIRTNQDKNGT